MSLKYPIKHLFNLALLSRWWWLLVVGVSIIHVVAAVVVAVEFLVLRTLVEITHISIGIYVFTLVSTPLESNSTNEVHIFFYLCSTLCVYSFCILN